MKKIRTTLTLLLGLLSLAALASHADADPSQSFPNAPTPAAVANDKADYAPGSTALFTGAGFRPGETVTLQVLHADGTPATGADHLPWNVTADEYGGFRTTWHVCQDDCVGSLLQLMAKAQTSGSTAQTTFRDTSTAQGSGAGAAPASGCRVLVLVDADTVGTTALVNALTSAGYAVTRRPAPEYTWNASNPPLTGFDCVVHLNGATYYAPLPVVAQTALVNFVNNGGAFIGGQWNGYERAVGQQTQMNDLVLQLWPFPDNCGGCNMTWTVVPGQQSHPVLAGIPSSFSFFADGHDAGQQVVFGVNPSTVLMKSPGGGPAVLVRQFGQGRVVNFSHAANYSLSGQTLQNPLIQQLYANAVAWSCNASHAPGVTFSWPVPNTGPYQTCIIGDFEDPSLIHKWKVRLRSGATESVSLTVVATTVNPAEGGLIKASLTDETGPQSVSVSFPASNGDYPGSLNLTLQGGKIYDLTIEAVPPTTGPVAHHYKLGAVDPRLELGWAGPLRYLEHQTQDWAVNADAGETINISVFTDPPPSGGANQATAITLSLTGPGNVLVFGPTTFTPNGTITVPNAASGSYTLHILQADGHFAVKKESGSDIGCYALDCPNKPPVAKCRDVLVFTGPDSCLVDASIDDGSFDPEGKPLNISQSPPGPYPVGMTPVKLIVTDDHGLTSTCTAIVTVKDITPPKIVCPPDITKPNDPGVCGAKVFFQAFATDNCGGATVKSEPPSGSVFPIGTTVVICTAVDGSGNTSSCTFNVTVVDTEPPTIACPADIKVNNDPGVCGAIVKFDAVAKDNCQAKVSYSQPPGTLFPVGTTAVKATAVDPAGNTTSCTFNVTVVDTEPPTIACPKDIIVSNDPGQCSALVNYPKAAATDNCGIASVVCSPPSGSVFLKGITTVTCVATDTAGNKSTCSFTVTVLDKEAPVADCKPTVNPAGNNIPTAGQNPKSGQNPDGFYELVAGDNCDGTNLFIYVKDSAEGPCGGAFSAGPYAPGTKVKLTQSPGQNSVKPMAGVIVAHINTKGEPVLVITDSSGNTVCHKCFVPPPPK